jgi:hypothetical protein
MPMPVCAITGVILEESTRSAPGRGISEGITHIYYDVKVDVLDVKVIDDAGMGEAALSKCPEAGAFVFQRRTKPSFWQRLFKNAEQCIKARTSFFGDGNFMSGQWLYDIKSVERDICDRFE